VSAVRAPSLIPLAEASGKRCGGKAAGLRRLLELGLRVPPGACVPVEVYRAALGGALPPRELGDDLVRAAEAARSLAAAFERWSPPPALRRELARVGDELGWPLVVRSSASCEDSGGVACAGVFASTRDVADVASLCAAIRRAWLSLWDVAAWAALRRAGRWPGEEAMAVVIQRQLRARWAGLLLSRDHRGEERMRIEATTGDGAAIAQGEIEPEIVLLPRAGAIEEDALAGGLTRSLLAELRDAALLVERSLAPGAAAELEWLIGKGGKLALVQARETRAAAAAPSFAVSYRSDDDARTRWRWDREHNPEPLSPLHAGLIEWLDARGPGPAEHLVLSGYLYRAQRLRPLPTPPASELWRSRAPELERLIGSAEALASDPRAHLDAALDSFAAFAQAYALLTGARRAARERLRAHLAELAIPLGAGEERLLELGEPNATLELADEVVALADEVAREPALESYLRSQALPALERAPSAAFVERVRALLGRFGALPRVWDVASPTLAEEPERLIPLLLARGGGELAHARAGLRAAQLATARELAARLRAPLSPQAAERLDLLVAEARRARALAEDDDLYFARALAALRRSLLAAGAHLVSRRWLSAPDEVFLLELEELVAALRRGHPGRDLRTLALQRESVWRASRRLEPPLAIHGARMTFAPPPAPERALLAGHGVGGVARGEVRLVARLEELLARPAEGAVLVCATILPALAVALPAAAALVTDHGGLLSHAASLARELGVPAVVGTGVATRLLRDGERVWVDGQRGLVVREE
jgi:pyruvate,water dikinase